MPILIVCVPSYSENLECIQEQNKARKENEERPDEKNLELSDGNFVFREDEDDLGDGRRIVGKHRRNENTSAENQFLGDTWSRKNEDRENFKPMKKV